MNQGVSRWPLTAEDGFILRKIHVGFAVERVSVGKAQFSPVSITPPTVRTDVSFISHGRYMILATDSALKLGT
jgi:hypothetical protein